MSQIVIVALFTKVIKSVSSIKVCYPVNELRYEVKIMTFFDFSID